MNKSQNWDKALQAPSRHKVSRHRPAPAVHLRRWGPAYKGGGSPVPTDAAACGVKLKEANWVDDTPGVDCRACKMSVQFHKRQRKEKKSGGA